MAAARLLNLTRRSLALSKAKLGYALSVYEGFKRSSTRRFGIYIHIYIYKIYKIYVCDRFLWAIPL